MCLKIAVSFLIVVFIVYYGNILVSKYIQINTNSVHILWDHHEYFNFLAKETIEYFCCPNTQSNVVSFNHQAYFLSSKSCQYIRQLKVIQQFALQSKTTLFCLHVYHHSVALKYQVSPLVHSLDNFYPYPFKISSSICSL